MSVFNHICGDEFNLYKYVGMDSSGLDSIHDENPIELEGKINKIGTHHDFVKGEMGEMIEVLFPSDAIVASMDRIESQGFIYEVYNINPMRELKIVKAVKIGET